MATLLQNQLYFYDLCNEIIELSLKESLLFNLERDLKLRYTTLGEKEFYLTKLKRDLIQHIDQETTIEVYNLIDIQETDKGYILNKNQFFDFCEAWVNLKTDFEKETSLAIKDHNGQYPAMIDAVNDIYIKHNAYAPEQITRLSFWMYCLNSNINKVRDKQPKEFKPNLTVFKTPESHRFFIYLFDTWLKDLTNCRPQLSFILQQMRENTESDRINDFAIHCKKTTFAEYWNSLNHPFKITTDKHKKINLSTEPSNIYIEAFKSKKSYFIENLM